MDRYEGAARLEWWANRNTCLCSVDVHVVIVNDEAGWRVSATFASPPTTNERESWTFLLALSPYCTLRFDADHDAAIDVHVEEPTEGELTLSAA